jgi:hypothetical protein
MLVVSKQRFLPTSVNTLVLQKDDNYFYVHRDVYDKAVVLSDRHKLETLMSTLEVNNNADTMEWFYANAPSPINILAPYIGLVEEGIEQEIEICCGVLHVITSVIDVRNFIQQPQALRKSVSFSLSVREEYEMTWERFFLTAVKYDDRNVLVPYMIAGQALVGGGFPSTESGRFSASGPNASNIPQQGDEDYDDGPEKHGPGWTKTGDGVYYNTDSGETMFEENEEEDADFLDSLFGDTSAEAGLAAVAAADTEPVSSEDERTKTKKLLSLDVD